MAARTILEFGSDAYRLAVTAWRIVAMAPDQNIRNASYTKIFTDNPGGYDNNSYLVNESYADCVARWRAAIEDESD